MPRMGSIPVQLKFPAFPDNDKKVDASTYRWTKEKEVIPKQKNDSRRGWGKEGSGRKDLRAKKAKNVNGISNETIGLGKEETKK